MPLTVILGSRFSGKTTYIQNHFETPETLTVGQPDSIDSLKNWMQQHPQGTIVFDETFHIENWDRLVYQNTKYNWVVAAQYLKSLPPSIRANIDTEINL